MPERSRVSELSATEVGVLIGAARGETAAQTAVRMGRSSESIRNHRRTAIRKLGARNLPHAVHLISPLIAEVVR